MTPEVASSYEAEEFNPVTTDGWRWKAVELMPVCQNEEEEPTPRVTVATDVWAFAMTIIEARTHFYLTVRV
jgi:hypothetical protein